MYDLLYFILVITFMSLFFGLVYPAIMLFYYKVLRHSKKSARQILNEI